MLLLFIASSIVDSVIHFACNIDNDEKLSKCSIKKHQAWDCCVQENAKADIMTFSFTKGIEDRDT